MPVLLLSLLLMISSDRHVDVSFRSGALLVCGTYSGASPHLVVLALNCGGKSVYFSHGQQDSNFRVKVTDNKHQECEFTDKGLSFFAGGGGFVDELRPAGALFANFGLNDFFKLPSSEPCTATVDAIYDRPPYHSSVVVHGRVLLSGARK